MPETCRDTDYQ